MVNPVLEKTNNSFWFTCFWSGFKIRLSMSLSEEIYLAGGCLWGVQEFVRHLPGVLNTEAGRANGSSQSLDSEYDGYAECVHTIFDPEQVKVTQLIKYFFEIIDPYSLNRQGPDIGEKYRTGIYSKDEAHLIFAREFIRLRPDAKKIVVEVLPLTLFISSASQHQDRLSRYPNERCHIPKNILHKYKSQI